jgi:hypothetical protein
VKSRVILQPTGNSDSYEHYADTIKEPVEVNRIVKFLSESQLNELSDTLEGKTHIRIWGVTPGKGDVNRKKWLNIQSGDVTLFSRNGKIFASTTALAKIHNRELALDLWKTNSDGDTWEYIYFLDELTEHDIPYSKFNSVVGYQPNFIIQGFNILDETKSEALLEAFDLRSSNYFPEIREDEYIEAISTLKDAESLDSVVTSKGRTEQQFLRKILFGNKSISNCCICGKNLPVSLLWASHIKKRSICTLDEKKDFKNIAAPMCRLGCDELFEKKFISVNHEGLIAVSSKIDTYPELKAFIYDLNRKKCLAWNDANKIYFAWHYDSFLSIK